MASDPRPLVESDVDPDPIVQFRRWYDDAEVHGVSERDAMVVATATPDGAPNARVVLFRGIDDGGFRFFTNVESTKGRELEANPRAAVLFHWHELHRQVRARGTVERLPDADADTYWRSRPRVSRISAWASAQSEPIASRAELDARRAAVAGRYGRHADGDDVPLPPFWGGYRVVVDELELWQHREDRSHDRLRYTRAPDGTWRMERLQP